MSAAVPDRTPVIVGIGLSDYPKAPDLDTIGHHVQAMQRALADSGVDKRGHRRLPLRRVGMTDDDAA